MAETNQISHAQILEMFGYDAQTGNLLWKIRPSNRIAVGQVAGVIASNGRRYVSIDGRRHLAHRIVWFHQKGDWPPENISPENGDYLDTRIENLIPQTAVETVHRSGVRSNNKSGVKGVSWNSTRGVWAVHAYRNYESVFLGQFKQLDDAIECKRNADVGVFPVDEDVLESRKLNKRDSIQSRRAWALMLKLCDGVHGWSTKDQFYADVGEQPETNYDLVPVDESRPIGPGNFEWRAPRFDMRTREGRIAAGKDYKSLNYELYRNKQLMKTFGISSKDYDAKMIEQAGGCAICSRPETAIRKGKLLPLSVDHNHSTGAVRGLLCTACNIGIGSLQDSAEMLRAAITYLDKWNAVETAPMSDNVVKLKKD